MLGAASRWVALVQTCLLAALRHAKPWVCSQVITKLLYLLVQGDNLTKVIAHAGVLRAACLFATGGGWYEPSKLLTRCTTLCLQKESTDIFFAVTKLYQSKDANLRRMVFLMIKETCPDPGNVIIIVSSLMKDMNSKLELYRSNAIRVLCSITDSQILAQIERYLKQVRQTPRGTQACSAPPLKLTWPLTAGSSCSKHCTAVVQAAPASRTAAT